jgi:hypothetical protein
MSDPFSGFSDDERGGGAPSEITEDGMYEFKVISAFDSYKVNPQDENDPEQSRRVNLRLKVLNAVQDDRDGMVEPEADVERRQRQRGNVRDVSLWFDKEGNASLIEGNMKILASIAGSPQEDRPDEDLMREYHKGKEDGENVFEIGQIADQMHINCSSLLGRDFIAVIEDTGDDYPSLFPWYAKRVPDEEQTPFNHPETDSEEVQTRGNLYSGTDESSARMKEIFEGSSGEETAYAGEADDGADIDDELPF